MNSHSCALVGISEIEREREMEDDVIVKCEYKPYVMVYLHRNGYSI